MLNKEKFANRATRLMGGRSRATMVAVAFVALLAVVAGGVLLASRAADVQQELMRSSLVAAVATPSEQGLLSRILADPGKSELLMKYINSLAGAVTNMEVSPGWHLAQFAALADAAESAGVSVSDFTFDSGEQRLTAACAAADAGSAEAFAELLRESGSFSRVEITAGGEGEWETFTTDCYFSDWN